ncbi:MAG: DHH family phosphoesterase [Planctomycetes bacterium]|nr:DHH family phosphoesterase [Planctomycetota bacterium]
MAHALEGRTKTLIELLRERKRLLVLSHSNPDPDSLASAAGLRLLASTCADLPSVFGYSGKIMRAENREMVSSCNIDMVRLKDVDVSEFDCLALVDTQPGFGHTHLPEGRKIDIVVDHHLPPESPFPAPDPEFLDVRTHIGATSSIVTGYLMEAGVDVPTDVATALLYGIRTDTADLARNASPLDEEAYDFLLRRADRQALSRITTPDLSHDYFRTLKQALTNTRIYNEVILCSLGKIRAPEMVAEVADLLLRLEGNQTVFCGGQVEDLYVVSVRTELERDAYYLIRGAFDGIENCSFGGHGRIAGGSVTLPDTDERTVSRIERRLERNILKTMGVDGVTVKGFGGLRE